jgi:hypothetical protein
VSGVACAENRDPWLLKQEEAIRARGGVDPMYANNPGKLRSCNDWVKAARPILQSIRVLDRAHVDLIDAARGFSTYELVEAGAAIGTAGNRLEEIAGEMRSEAIHSAGAGLRDDPIEQEEADDFSDWLDENTISVNDALKMLAQAA